MRRLAVKVSIRTVGVIISRESRVSRTAARTENAKATRFPTNRARSCPRVISPSEIGHPARTPTTPATRNCCHRRGGRVSGSDSMNTPRKRNGEDHSSDQKIVSASTASPAVWYWIEVRAKPTATATSRNTRTMRIFSVRHSTASPRMTTGAARTGVPTHHADAPSAGIQMLTIVRTAAPTAAGLKMWRPRQANRYLDAAATAPASATPTRATGSRVGRRTNSRMNAVITEDSSRSDCPMIRCATTSTMPHATASTARVASSSRGLGATRPKNETPNATTVRPSSARKTMRYIETLPSTANTRFQPAVNHPIM